MNPERTKPKVLVLPLTSLPEVVEEAAVVADEIGLPFLPDVHGECPPEQLPTLAEYDLVLWVDTMLIHVQELRQGRLTGKAFTPLHNFPDVISPAGRSWKQPILKAVGVQAARKRGETPLVLDLTLGWGTDAWLLAAFGCEVLAFERNAIIRMMTESAFLFMDDVFYEQTGTYDSPECPSSRIIVFTTDSFSVLKAPEQIESPIDINDYVLYLDPMFPDHDQRKTAPKKSMTLARWLTAGEPNDEDELFEAAMNAGAKRVVIKRPLRAPLPLGLKPSLQFEGKGHRFDVYL